MVHGIRRFWMLVCETRSLGPTPSMHTRHGPVAQPVEHVPEEHGVGSSTLSQPTRYWSVAQQVQSTRPITERPSVRIRPLQPILGCSQAVQATGFELVIGGSIPPTPAIIEMSSSGKTPVSETGYRWSESIHLSQKSLYLFLKNSDCNSEDIVRPNRDLV